MPHTVYKPDLFQSLICLLLVGTGKNEVGASKHLDCSIQKLFGHDMVNFGGNGKYEDDGNVYHLRIRGFRGEPC